MRPMSVPTFHWPFVNQVLLVPLFPPLAGDEQDILPIRIEVIHMKHDDIFADKGNLAAVLELYQTIIILE